MIGKNILDLTFKILINLYFIDGDTKNELINFVKQNNNIELGEEQNLKEIFYLRQMTMKHENLQLII